MSSEFVQDVECPSCSRQATTKLKRTFVKQLRIGRLPEVLCFYIVRTVWLPDGSMTKNTTHLEFPYSLDVSSYMAYTDHTIRYKPSQQEMYVYVISIPGTSTNFVLLLNT